MNFRLGTSKSPRSRIEKRKGTSSRRKLILQRLETRQLLAGDIVGSVFGDADGNGEKGGAEIGQSNVRVYIDVNLNGKFDGAPSPEPFDFTDGNGDFAIANTLSPGQRVSVRVDVASEAVTSPELRVANVASVEMQNDTNLPPSIPQPTNVQDIESADFNGDGVNDIVFFQGDDFDEVTVLLADPVTGDYGSSSKRLFPSDSGAQLTSGDIDGDGKAELVVFEPSVVSTNQDSVTVYRDDSNSGGFPAIKAFQIPNPTEVILADVDTTTAGLELLVLSGSAAELTIFRSVSGVFDTSVTISTNGLFTATMTAGDFNGDQALDVAISDSSDQSVIVMIGDGTGGFTAGDSILGFSSPPQALVSGLLEGADGDTDLAVINGNRVSIFRGDGQGGFTSARNLTADFNSNAAPSRLAAGDMDGDGDSELVFSSINDGRFALVDSYENRNGVLTPDFATQFGVAFDFAHPIPVAIGKLPGAPAHHFAVAAHYQQAEESDDAFPFPEALQVFGAGRQYRVTLQSDVVSLPENSFGVLPPPKTTIVLEGENETFSMSQPSESLDGITTIDIRGIGDNQIELDANVIRDTSPDSTITIIADAGDGITFDLGWEYDSVSLREGQLVKRFLNAGAIVEVIGPRDFTNPQLLEDVNGSGDVTAGDALVIINELARRRFSDEQTEAIGDISSIGIDGFFFFDVSEDLRISALDALRVINSLARNSTDDSNFASVQQAASSGEDTTRATSWDSAFVDSALQMLSAQKLF